MERSSAVADHPKKKRRRRLNRQPIPAWIQFSEGLKGEVGRISDDLYTSLFRTESTSKEFAPGASGIRYVAITPWTSRSNDPVIDEFWTILPVVAPNVVEPKAVQLPPSTVIISTTSPSLRNFVETLRSSVVAGNTSGKSGFEVLIIDVEPLALHSILVDIDGTALERHYEVQRKFGGGFSTAKINGITGKGKGKEKAQSAEKVGSATPKSPAETQADSLMIAIRQALGTRTVIRQDDFLPLPLPAHPITHVSFPPAKIAFAEPVSQGILVPNTQITVKQVYRKFHRGHGFSALAEFYPLKEMIAGQDDDTSNDQFYSAVENREATSNQSSLSGEESSQPSSPQSDSGTISEDSSEEVISMTTPRIQTDSHSANCSLIADTPRGPKSPSGVLPRPSGINSPGSVYSSFTSTTVRQGSVYRGGLFQAEPLLSKISESLLHPKPRNDEDEEARVFIDVKMLLKLGCFSGEWVKIDVAAGSSIVRDEFCNDEVGEDDKIVGHFRTAKIYGLPDLSPKHRSEYPRISAAGRPLSSNGSVFQNRSIHSAWFSPILLANLGSPKFVRLSPLKSISSETGFGPKAAKTQLSSSISPPIAKEVTLVKISTPLSTELALQASLFAALKRYFEAKRRILREGDIVPLAIDTTIGRILAQSSSASAMDKGIEEKLLMDLTMQNHQSKTLGICWFRVEQVTGPEVDQGQQFSDIDTWGCWACMEPMTTCVLQAGTETSRILSTVNSSWEYYLRIKPLPKDDALPNTRVIPWRRAAKLHTTSLGQRLRELIHAGISPEASQHGVGPMFILLRSTQRHIGKATLVLRACSDLGVHVFSINAPTLLADSGAGGADIKTELIFRAQIERALSCNPETTIVLVRHVEALASDRMTSVLKEVVTNFKVLVVTTTQVETVPEDLRSLFTHELEFSAPDETERENLLRTVIDERSIRLSHDVDLGAVAIKTAALVAGDLVDVVERAMGAREHRLESLSKQDFGLKQSSVPVLFRDILISGGENARCVTKADFDLAVDAARKNFADSIGAPKIPNVSWDDVGGLENVKSAVMETIQLPLERPELFAKGMKKRSGILFYGPPGTGKTLLAKAIATEFSLNFFSVKGPELLNMYIGESEANVRRVFQRARDARPCVVFFDELDSVAPKRGNQGDSGGVMDRIVSQLLAELDGMSGGEAEGGGVFVIGATNRPDLLDPALLRPGRFDKMLYLGVSDTHDKQLRILEALTRKFRLDPDVSLRRVAEWMPFTYTGADLYAICSDAMLKAITRQCTAVDSRVKSLRNGNNTVTPAYFFDHLATPEDINVTVHEQDFMSAMFELVGSVSAKELEHYQHVRRSFEGADALKTANSQYHDTTPTRIPAPISTLAPSIANQVPKPKSRAAKPQSKVKGTDERKGKGKGKGKGKATVWDSPDDTDEDEDGDGDGGGKRSYDGEDEAYLTSHDFEEAEEGEEEYRVAVPARGKYGVNGNGNGNGNRAFVNSRRSSLN